MHPHPLRSLWLFVSNLLPVVILGCGSPSGPRFVTPAVIVPDPRPGAFLVGSLPQPVPGPTFLVNPLTLRCQEWPDLAAPVRSVQAPGTVWVIDQVLRTASGVWHHDLQRECWVRTTPGPVRAFASGEAAAGYAARFPTPGSQASLPPRRCGSGCATHPAGCDIKSQVRDIGDPWVYYLPGDRDYDEVVVLPERGERWFCTEADAQDNGWVRRTR